MAFLFKRKAAKVAAKPVAKPVAKKAAAKPAAKKTVAKPAATATAPAAAPTAAASGRLRHLGSDIRLVKRDGSVTLHPSTLSLVNSLTLSP